MSGKGEPVRLPLLLCSLFGVAAVGCGPGTSVKVRIQNPTAMNATALEVAIYDDFGLMARKAPKPQLPGELTLVGLPAQSEKLRIVVKGTGSATLLGWATVATRSGSAVNADVSLSMDFKDSDGDFVPDEIDGCPNVADPDQLDSDGSSTGAGDACRGSGDPARCSGTLCDSFDMPSIDAGKWTTASSFGNVSIDTTRSFHGPSSLKVRSEEHTSEL